MATFTFAGLYRVFLWNLLETRECMCSSVSRKVTEVSSNWVQFQFGFHCFYVTLPQIERQGHSPKFNRQNNFSYRLHSCRRDDSVVSLSQCWHKWWGLAVQPSPAVHTVRRMRPIQMQAQTHIKASLFWEHCVSSIPRIHKLLCKTINKWVKWGAAVV